MGYTKGQKVTLKNAASYESSTSSASGRKRTGTFYIWSAATKNGRIRITTKKSYAGKNPASKYVTCWVKISAIKAGKTHSTAKPQKTSTGNKKSSSTKKTTTATVKSKKTATVTTNIIEASDVMPKGVKQGQIGYLGKVLFIVSSTTIQTLKDFEWGASASYEEHGRHLKRPTLEFTGINSENITFTMELSAFLGVKVMDAWNTLKKYMETGTAVPLKIGTKKYGNYRWCVKSLTFSGGVTTKAGNWATAKVKINLISTEKKG